MRTLALAMLAAALPAWGQTEEGCQKWIAPGLGEGPIALGLYEADTVTGRRACPRSEIGLGTRAGAVVDTADFYGAIALDGWLFGSYAHSSRLELFGTFEAVHYQYVQNATIKGAVTSVGQLTAGAAYLTLSNPGLLITTTVRAMLPTAMYTPNVRTLGLEAGESFSYRPGQKLELHAHLAGDLSLGLSAANPFPRAGVLLNAGLQYSPWTRLGLVLDANGRLGSTSYLAPAAALRMRLFEGLGAELGAMLPLWGTDRHDAVLGLRLGQRL